jgi:hypothetical protein
MTTPNDLRAREAFRQRRTLLTSESLLFWLAAAGVWILLLAFVWLAIGIVQ